ncbi:hypothetical protein GXW82_05315 [Streptacidiphilus sp. 4-A2]|nr:hypothetical protein [Streptacidiphilus sp. 4-A2]
MHGHDERGRPSRQTPRAAVSRRASGPHPQASGALSEADVLALQRSVGNAAVTAMLRSARPVVVQQAATDEIPAAAGPQSAGPQGNQAHAPAGGHAHPVEPEDRQTTTGRVTGMADVGGAAVGAATATTVGPGYTDPSNSTQASYAGGIFSPFLSGITGAIGLGFSVRSMRGARKKQQESQGSAPHRSAVRELDSSRAEAAQNASALTGNLLNGAGGAMSLAGQATPVYNAVFSAGGAAALPASVLQTGRYARKAAKARARVLALRELMASETSEPKARLAAADQEVAACQEQLDSLRALYQAEQQTFELRSEELKGSPLNRPLGTDLDTWKEALLALQAREQEVAQAVADRNQAEARQAQARLAQQAMRDALTAAATEVKQHRDGAPDKVSLRMIQAYAFRKNNRGTIKKAVAAAGGALGSAGAVAALVVSIAVAAGTAAGAGLLLATPVGWALAGAAATVGLGLASYKAWKYFAKRWQATRKDDAGGLRSGPGRLGRTSPSGRRPGRASARSTPRRSTGWPGASRRTPAVSRPRRRAGPSRPSGWTGRRSG